MIAEFTHCPICAEPLINLFCGEWLIKYCARRVDHTFNCDMGTSGGQTVSSISVILFSNIVFHWLILTKELYFGEGIYSYVGRLGYKSRYKLPYFEPDFSDCHKLKEKLKTYVTLS